MGLSEPLGGCRFLSSLPYGPPLGPGGANDREGERETGGEGIKEGGRERGDTEEKRAHRLE